MRSKIVVGIDATRALSGGGVNHLRNILYHVDITNSGIREVHLWVTPSISEHIVERDWLVKHSPNKYFKGIFLQLLWQFAILPMQLRKAGCDIVLNVDAGSFNPFKPSVTMSRDMLPFDPMEMKRYRYGIKWFRLIVLKYISIKALRRANCSVFLTNYAYDVIKNSTGNLKNAVIIPHGVSSAFSQLGVFRKPWTLVEEKKIKIVYVSHWTEYKNHSSVLRAIDILISRGFNLELTLVGKCDFKKLEVVGGFLDNPMENWLRIVGHVEQDQLLSILASKNIFLFASSCENMPNTLLEGMAAQISIACSNKQPMPEILGNGGVYFEPTCPFSIAQSISLLICDNKLRESCIIESYKRSREFSWKRCSAETFRNLEHVYEKC